MLRALALSALAVLPAPQSAAGELCGVCQTTGKLPNPWYAAHHDDEIGSRFCSTDIEGDRAACGAEFVPCPRCKRPDLAQQAAKAVAERKATHEKWLAEQRATDAKLATKLCWVESDHFLIGFEPARYRTRDKRDLDGHDAAHLFARRLEGMYADFQRLFGFDDARVRNQRHQVLIFEQLKHMAKASEELLSMSSDTAAKLAGDPSILVTWTDKNSLSGDLEIDRHVTHHVTHLLCSVFHLKEWLYSQGFLDEGLAHCFEMRYFLVADNSCNQEEQEEDFGGRSWPKDVLLAVKTGKHPSVAELCSKRTDQLRGSDHSFAWSFADFLLASGPEQVTELMVRIKEKTELREALREVYGRTFFELERDWKAHVLETYPARAKPIPAGAKVVVPGDELRGRPDRPPTSPSSGAAPSDSDRRRSGGGRP